MSNRSKYNQKDSPVRVKQESPAPFRTNDRRNLNRERSHSRSEKSRRRSRSRSRDRQGSPRRPSNDRRSPRRNSRERQRDEWNGESRNQLERDSEREAMNPIRDTRDDAKRTWGHEEIPEKTEKNNVNDKDKEKPNFGLSGKLLEDTNMVNGVVINYAQPPEARKPKVRWRLYPFKGEESLPTMFIHRQSAYLLGRDRKVVDIALDHPSCSKQHAVIQYRMIPVEKGDGTVARKVKPYIIDLNSGNGTMVNQKRIESQRFVELLEKDVIKFGFSTREYVMLHEGSKNDEYHSDDDDRLES